MDERAPFLARGLTAHPRASELTLFHRELLGRRLLLNSLVRFAVGGIFLTGGLAADLLGFLEPGVASRVMLLGLVVALYDIPIFLLSRRYHAPQDSAVAYRQLLVVMYVAIVADYLVLAMLVALMGGARSPFLAFYLLHVTLSCVMLSRRAAVGFTLLAYGLIVVQVGMEWGDLVPSTLPFEQYVPVAPLDGQTAVQILLVYGILFAFTDALLISLAEWLRRSERELREKNERLDQLSDLRRDFLHVAVHNLRTPVGAAVMYLDNLSSGLAGPLRPEQQKWVDRSRLRLARLLDLLEDMKILGDLETRNLGEQAEWVELQEVVRGVVEDYQELADAEGLVLVPDPAGSAPRVWGIPRLLSEALANLVTNAIRHAPGSGPVELTVRPISKNGDPWVRTSVEDRGPGISPEFHDRLFREFARTPGSGNAAESKGTGLGLSIVRRIVEAHGGHVGLDSRPGEGSTFYFDLPAQPTSPGSGAEERE